ncbi:hypothetical protein ARC20_12515 [Stenotrophomonas panacihumi]|uniref:Cobalamin ABC transporter n=1 Tax=Stenotrophomonas panacihumi TaxID=676599 RepID=A0A0R0A740_9GAMM|nr:hypothetical protein [Stenotrophomonas panacihumi]KRG40749.1 hypothetical protein ARC20_12515 [Stenotrophomonas panacihumi]PTN54826.1 hypothetical protein C9J98_09025 [Stenotrophomonas panacihumi]
MNETSRPLPLPTPAAQWIAGLLLAALMICTRGQHFASVNALPSASWAVFFLAGALLRPMWTLPVFFLLSSALDIGSLAAGTITDWCISPAYWALAFAYAALWLGGHVYARRLHDGSWRSIPRLALALVATATVAYVLSKGGYYFFSGHYPQADLAGFLARVPHYYPRSLGTMAGYVAVGMALVAIAQRLAARRPDGALA